MELPNIGEHCAYSGCNLLDFLPFSCDMCKQTFCSSHHKYENHSCPEQYKLDIRIPICPLCDKPVSSKRGQPPDLAVNEHIQNNCQSKSKKIYANKCSNNGCKNKEMVSVKCSECDLNFCLRHRHPTDHNCRGAVVARREKTLNGSIFKNWVGSGTSSNSKSSSTNSSGKKSNVHTARSTTDRASVSTTSGSNLRTLQGNINESEALRRAMEASQKDSNSTPTPIEQIQEDIDADLARAIALSLEDQGARTSNSNQNKKDCCLS